MTTVLTRKDCENQLPEGADPLLVALHVAATAEDRAVSRRRAVRDAAMSWLTDAHERALPALLAIELGGIGGRMGFGPNGGDATQRMGWARGLGRGRRHATDGTAWTDAIQHEFSVAGGVGAVTSAMVVQVAELCSVDDIEWPLAYALRRAYAVRTLPEESAPWASCARQIASLCEANSDAGRLADRWQLQTRRAQLDAEFGA